MTQSIPTVVVGGSGYVAGELLRLIAVHPQLELAAAVSQGHAGESIGACFPHLATHFDGVVFVGPELWPEQLPDNERLAVFSAAPHGASAAAIDAGLVVASQQIHEIHVVDISADFRFPTAEAFQSVYDQPHGAPELLQAFSCGIPEHTPATSTPHIAHPGCFATAVLLATAPLLATGNVQAEVFVAGVTGSTGSGRSPQAGTHHPQRHSNLYAYKPLAHRHVPEISLLLERTTGVRAQVNFVPHSGPYARGIHVTVQGKTSSRMSTDKLLQSMRDYYRDAEFVQVVDGTPRLKDVVASNYCHIGAEVRGDSVAVFCVIDNLLKGAAGGAMQWMNRLWALPEHTGLTAPAPSWT